MSGTRRHTFSHFTLRIEVVTARLESVSGAVADAPDRSWVAPDERARLGMPTPVKAILDAVDRARSGHQGDSE
jgi:adenine-specific DNA glycosylase